ncbi:MAG TPA: SagB/ThcOx family dehydrogenase [candidate division Zixibacteria bacterium]|nr:SagB/ThcOx family dehydrogenase [candidate division Zixibacteria bacterium]MDD4917118.1 SagB/ThcOx family dehydrogenase [candidate division Zixibacteria bacterium]MDM7972698.1 SagB/ThcOx family dehydrogenase [candidate division Zixibacteria bacterium]HOD65387.1 SagB/ThcOx family dehydrogenase [candidate division Zixibacteria bacterium]HPM36175.1 SagB/ThcOx family dehydrogenase [candidate division Zixibacteria bacterium]
MKRIHKTIIPALILSSSVMAQDLAPITLPPPDTSGGKPLMEAIKNRRSTREFSPDSLPPAVLSDLLWAAGGINRPESGKRTAPSAMNWQEIDIYVALPDAAYRYEPKDHSLQPVLAGDIRAQTGMQPFVKDAAVNLVYVANFTRMGDPPKDEGERLRRENMAYADAAFMCENAYLYCASAGLAAVVRASIDSERLAKTLSLSADQRPLLAQTIGYPKE